MALSTMQGALTKSGPLSSHSKAAGQFNGSRVPHRRRAIVPVNASTHQGPSDLVMKGVGALAAAQLVFFPSTAAAALPNLPKTATSQAARDDLNARTDNLPSLKQAGKELVNNLPGGGGDEVQNKASGLANKASKEANKIGNKINNATPDLSAAPDLNFDLKGDVGNRSGSMQGSDVGDAKDMVADEAKAVWSGGNNQSSADPAFGRNDNPNKAGEGAFGGAAQQPFNTDRKSIGNAVPDLSEASEIEGDRRIGRNGVGPQNKLTATPGISDAPGAANAAGRKFNRSVNPTNKTTQNASNQAIPDLGDAAHAVGDAKDAVVDKAQTSFSPWFSFAKKAVNKAVTAVDGSDVGGAVKSAANKAVAAVDGSDVKGAANSAANKVSSKVGSKVGGQVGEKVGSKINNAAGDLSVADTADKPFSDKVGNAVSKAASNLTKDTPDLGDASNDIARDARNKAGAVGNKINNATPDLSAAPDLNFDLKGDIGNRSGSMQGSDVGDAKDIVADEAKAVWSGGNNQSSADPAFGRNDNPNKAGEGAFGGAAQQPFNTDRRSIGNAVPDLSEASEIEGLRRIGRNGEGPQNKQTDTPGISDAPGAANAAGRKFNRSVNPTNKTTQNASNQAIPDLGDAGQLLGDAKDAVADKAQSSFTPWFGAAKKQLEKATDFTGEAQNAANQAKRDSVNAAADKLGAASGELGAALK